ncbi:Zinc finger, LSD1-type [Trema orientale]|uniref:Zinc finger, LSD1-type n=1 Tax=Trema orientale TaxID=63057 RepID=A0A2P5AHP7_TREOI|nr:Zinc finger, LSD1-type [Trema orientale]
MESKQVEEDDGPPPGYQSILPSPQPPSSPLKLPPEPPPPTAPPPQPPPTTLTPTTKTTPSETAQMVCGSCHRLLKYPPGARQVQRSCCQTVNFVLEAHQVGQVKCGSCTVLLMYPYGASQVRCSSCQHVTEIGAHNRRPPWSVQQGQPLPGPNPCY